RAGTVLDQLAGDERAAVAAREDEALRPALSRLAGEVEHLGHVGEVVEREPDRLRREARHLTEVVLVGKDLQIEQANVVTGLPYRRGYPLEPERLESQVDLGVHERTRMNQQHAHETPSS